MFVFIVCGSRKCVCTLFLFLLLVSASLAGYGQTAGPFVSYTVNDGLPQSSIQSITQDKNGFLWVATADGVCRFDGYTFKSYKHDAANPRSANSDWHNHFYTARDGRLWMASYNGISRYNSETDDFTNVLTYDTDVVVTTENKIYGEDDRFLWAGLSNWGLVKIDKRTLKPSRVNVKGLFDPIEVHSWYRGFMEKGKIWLLTRKDFYIYDLSTGSLQKPGINLLNLISVNDTLAAGYDAKHIVLINKKTLKTERIMVHPAGADHALTGALVLNPSEILFHSDPNGLLYFNHRTRKITRRVSSAGDATTKKFLAVACAYTDRSGNLWVGTNNDGLFKQNRAYRNFRLYRSPDTRSNQVFSIYADSGRVYNGVANNGMDVFARNGGFLKNVKVNSMGIPSLNYAAVTVPVDKNKLMLLVNSGITRGVHTPSLYDRSTGKLSPAHNTIRENHRHYWGQGNFRQFVYPYAPGVFLTNVGEYLLALKRDTKGDLTEEVVHRFKDQMLSCAFKDSKGNLWIGVYKGAFVRTTDGWRAIKLPKPVEVKCILEDREGNFWLATGIGIYILDKDYRVKEFLDEQNKLLNEHVYAMLMDGTGDIWFSHNKGLTVYRWNQKKFQDYNDRDGLQAAEFNSAAYFKAANGELFFGGINGTSSFFPAQIKDNPHAPKPLITGVGLFDKPYTQRGSAWEMKSLSLPYDQNSLSFDFTLPEYSDPARNRYHYTLEGVDKGWINSGDRRFARYPALAPGNYVFKVRAANPHGIWSKQEATIRVSIIPPFWQRGWFLMILASSAILLIVVLVRFIERQRYKRQMRALEVQHRVQAERERISRDLHDNIGTQLSLINKSIKEVIEPSRDITEEERWRRLDSAREGSVEVMDTLRDTIWALNKPEISLQEFSDNLKKFLQKQLAQHPELTLQFDEPAGELGREVILSPTEALNLFRISQEAIANAVKYSKASTLGVAIEASEGQYSIRITDNGVGFDTEAASQTYHYGLENMKYRAGEMHYDLQIESRPGQGTQVTVKKK